MIQDTREYTVITGASSGIGYETAKSFAGRGSDLILTARRKDRLEKLKQEILSLNPECDIIIKIADLSEADNVFKFYTDVKNYPLRTWINNAGVGNYSSVWNQNLYKIRRMMRLNRVISSVLLTSSLSA